MEFAQICDRVDIERGSAIDHTGLIGTWVNSNPDTRGVARMHISEMDGKLFIRISAIGAGDAIDWGLADVSVFAASPTAQTAAGFTSRYDFGFVETLLQGMMLKGLMVLAQFHTFKDDSQRAPFFVREYFALEHGCF